MHAPCYTPFNRVGGEIADEYDADAEKLVKELEALTGEASDDDSHDGETP